MEGEHLPFAPAEEGARLVASVHLVPERIEGEARIFRREEVSSTRFPQGGTSIRLVRLCTSLELIGVAWLTYRESSCRFVGTAQFLLNLSTYGLHFPKRDSPPSLFIPQNYPHTTEAFQQSETPDVSKLRVIS